MNIKTILREIIKKSKVIGSGAFSNGREETLANSSFSLAILYKDANVLQLG